MSETTKHDYISIAETDPGRMGWMQGFPPQQDKILSAADGSFFQFPALRYSVNHMREFLPTREVSANKEKDGIHKFHVKLMKELDTVTFTPWKEANAITWGESLERNFTDGIIILHRGHIVYERYFAGMSPWGHHAAMSVSKSFAGLLASILVAEGKLEEHRSIGSYIPELQDSGFGDATVRQVMDMTTAIQFSEDYNDPNSDIWKLSQAGNVFRPANYSGPGCYYQYLPAIKKDPSHDHGEAFHYRTANTMVLGWLISRVTGKGLAQLLSEMIWRPMGASSDAYYQLDPAGIAFAGGGLSMGLRDMALFGELMRNEGKLSGIQLIPKKAVQAITTGGDPHDFERGHEYPDLTGWSYRSMWWITHNHHKAYMARGVHGQAIYIDPMAEMVIARFASNPLSSNKYIDPLSLPAYEAVANYLLVC